jgi:hypothetical protein
MHADYATAQATMEIMNRVGEPKSDREVIDQQAGQIARLTAALDSVSLERDRLQAQVNTMRGRLPNALRALGV